MHLIEINKIKNTYALCCYIYCSQQLINSNKKAKMKPYVINAKMVIFKYLKAQWKVLNSD